MSVLIACETVSWKFKCPKKWGDLTLTYDPKVRFCNACSEKVYFCDDAEELSLRSRERVCVAFFQNPYDKPNPDYAEMDKPVMVGRPSWPFSTKK